FVDWRTGTRVENGYTIPAGYADAGRSFATYVSPDGLCNTSGRTPLINGFVDILGPNRGNSFHPNSTGYWLGAELVSAAIRAHQRAERSAAPSRTTDAPRVRGVAGGG
ncbi:MAG: hypothetical protein KC479_15010, partial [Dehalococcoidia bacterium]|nr:hypothetical protein [Dehalococcoidia bacterium]